MDAHDPDRRRLLHWAAVACLPWLSACATRTQPAFAPVPPPPPAPAGSAAAPKRSEPSP